MLKKYIVDLLEDNPLNGIGTYNDVLTLSTGVINRKIDKLVLTGEENDWVYNEQLTFFYLSVVIPEYLKLKDVVTSVCSHYRSVAQTIDATSLNNGEQSFWYAATVQRLYIKDTAYTTLAAFKTFLRQQYAAGTPVTVWYVLATDTTEQITVPTGLSGTVDGYTTQSGTPTPTAPIYPTANTVTMWANYTPSRYNGIAFVTATGQPEQYNGGWT